MSLRSKFTGTGIAIVTPFQQDGTIDWASYEKLIEFWIKGKVEYLVVLGTTGESATVHGEDKQAVFTFVKDKVAGRLPLVAGIGGYDTQEVLKGFRSFDLSGYDAILSVSPYYNKPNQEGIFQHYKTLDAATPLPIMIYNVPSRTGQNMTADTQLRIARECRNIFATKEASGNLDQIMQLIKNKPADFMVISGDDGITLPMIALGADGVTSVVANAYPAGFSEMVRLCLQGKFEEARILHYQYVEIIQTMFAEGSPSGVKAYLSQMGLCSEAVRQPVWPVSDALRSRIKELMKVV
ncbi:MAG: 4-hydroxy-tetrahydrodipicolinate synthase [Chitinophagaceae bacterium]|jgi:4-hydroxy-tetrahydrodipicolinate synthase|nr:4-hydroxy-tetrahydrodipicolinate synthase [Chitinophagaceae bacterium]